MKRNFLSITIAIMVGAVISLQGVVSAFGLPNIGAVLGGESSSDSGSSKIDIEGLTNKQNVMLENLAKSVVLFSAATLDVEQVLQLDPEIIGEQKLIFKNLSADRTNKDYIKKSAENKIPEKAMQEAAKAALDSGDQARINTINEAIQQAELKKQAAYIYAALAAKDAVDVIKEGSAGMKNVDGISKLQGIVKSAQLAQKICELQNKQINSMNKALKEYKATQNIKVPSDEEAKIAAEAWLKG